MKKLILICLLALPSYAMAQGVVSEKILTDNVVKADPPRSAYPNTKIDERLKKVEEKAKPVIIPNSKRQEWTIISLQLENAKLKAEAAVPAEIKKAVKDADEALAAFWKGVGINPAEIQTRWDVSDGQNGDIILTPKTEKKIEEKPKTP